MNYFSALLHPDFLRMLTNIKKKAARETVRLSVRGFTTDEHIPFAERLNYPYKKIHKFSALGGFSEGAWLHLQGKLPENANPGSIIRLNVLGEGTVYDGEGNPVAAMNTVVTLMDVFHLFRAKQTFAIPEECFRKGEIDLYVETANNGLMGKSYGKSRLMSAAIYNIDVEYKALYYDFLTLFFLYSYTEDGADKKLISGLLHKAYALSKKSAKAARDALSARLSEKSQSDTVATLIGHSHLDVVWLWRLGETRRKAARTFAAQLNNIEKYPNYIFGASQPLEYQWIKDRHPVLFARVKEAVAAGRIEPLGMMWVEPDMNLTSGECIIRHIYYGKQFFKREFGTESEICWLPDVFGYNGALPQIISKCGMKYFMTIKLSWNEHNKFPHTSFVWEGIDGSRVLAHMPPEGNYGSDAMAFSFLSAMKKDKDGEIKSFLVPFGSSDGGGGAGEGHLECIKRQENLKGLPRLKMGTAEGFFKDLEKVKDKLKIYKGELYLETHQATYTTQARNKLYNRRTESALHYMEFLESLVYLKTGGHDAERAEKLWKDALLEQFHDILPGSSTTPVHNESIERYKLLTADLEKYTTDLFEKIAEKNENYYTLTNASPLSVKEWIKAPDGWIYADLPPYTIKSFKKERKNSESKGLSYTETDVSNGILTLNFDGNGEISSLIKDGKDYGRLNVLTLYKDKRRFWNACNLDNRYFERRKRYFKLKSVKTYTDGAAVIREHTLTLNKSEITQKIILRIGCPYVEFDTSVEWRESMKMLRADFFPSYYADKAVCDIQFGNIKRSTKNETPEEKAQIEICAHKWLDVSGKEGGVAVMTDCKYGYRAKDGLISLNLLRSTKFPGVNADKGRQEFKYAVYPHEGETFESDITRLGYAFNNPVKITDGYKADYSSIAVSDSDNVILETVKPAFDGGITLRLYENEGRRTEVKLALNIDGLRKAYVADMLENEIEEADLSGLIFAPYEIKTIKLRRTDE